MAEDGERVQQVGTLKLYPSQDKLSEWQTSTPAVLNNPKELATVTMCPWLISSIVGRKALVVWKKSEIQVLEVTLHISSKTQDHRTNFGAYNVTLPNSFKNILHSSKRETPLSVWLT
jgi:hypothetical protein